MVDSQMSTSASDDHCYKQTEWSKTGWVLDQEFYYTQSKLIMLECQLYQKELSINLSKTKVGRMKSGVGSQELEQVHAYEKVFAMS